ncbi:MAG: hypothetical protein E7370_03450 [Clostridiales bacterium]|nr:hypothetical protein [Clostridiales bacterium]
MKKSLSTILKILTVVASLLGVTLALARAELDGYHPWWTRLLYFTNLSNIWIGLCMGVLLIFSATDYNGVWKKRFYTLKFVFTVSIAITAIVFCALLAPFAEEDYNAWSFANLLTHIFAPAFAISDFFLDDYPLHMRGLKPLYSTIPPLIYFVFSIILGALGVDFGRGVTYPYFFLDFNTPAGFFGFVPAEPRPYIGAFYWILVLLILVLLLGWAFAVLKSKTAKKHAQHE